MMNKKINLFLYLLLSCFFVQSGCGSSGDGGGGAGGEFSIDMPEGYALYGTINGADVQILEEDGEVSVFVVDKNGNEKFDDDESLAITITNFYSFSNGDYSSYVAAYTSPGVGNEYGANIFYSSEEGYVYTKTISSSLTKYNLNSSKIFFTVFEEGKGGEISGKFDLILENGEGELKGSFNGFLEFSHPVVPD